MTPKQLAEGISPDTKGIEPSPAMIECLKSIMWAQMHAPEEADVFWEDLAILINGLPDKRAIQ
jgi:hypothetical protein